PQDERSGVFSRHSVHKSPSTFWDRSMLVPPVVCNVYTRFTALYSAEGRTSTLPPMNHVRLSYESLRRGHQGKEKRGDTITSTRLWNGNEHEPHSTAISLKLPQHMTLACTEACLHLALSTKPDKPTVCVAR
ncbi:unnamed protein product, partial [Ectocarpus sp. 13 AM-2016]